MHPINCFKDFAKILYQKLASNNFVQFQFSAILILHKGAG
jgi:hypothetical protein